MRKTKGNKQSRRCAVGRSLGSETGGSSTVFIRHKHTRTHTRTHASHKRRVGPFNPISTAHRESPQKCHTKNHRKISPTQMGTISHQTKGSWGNAPDTEESPRPTNNFRTKMCLRVNSNSQFIEPSFGPDVRCHQRMKVGPNMHDTMKGNGQTKQMETDLGPLQSRKPLLEPPQELVVAHELAVGPAVVVEGHVLNEAHLHRQVPGELGEGRLRWVVGGGDASRIGGKRLSRSTTTGNRKHLDGLKARGAAFQVPLLFPGVSRIPNKVRVTAPLPKERKEEHGRRGRTELDRTNREEQINGGDGKTPTNFCAQSEHRFTVKNVIWNVGLG